MPKKKHTPTPGHGSAGGRLNRAVSAVAWYAPELITAGVAAGAAVTVWQPLGLVSVAVAGWIATERALLFRRSRALRKAARLRADQARLDRAADTQPLPRIKRGRDGWEVAG